MASKLTRVWLLKRKMSINFADLSSYQQVEVQKLVGDSFTSENTLDNPTNVDVEVGKAVIKGNSVNITLDTHSFTVIKVSKKEAKSTLESIKIIAEPKVLIKGK